MINHHVLTQMRYRAEVDWIHVQLFSVIETTNLRADIIWTEDFSITFCLM